MNRKVNFNPGPAALPLAVLEKAQKALLDFNGIGIGIMEISHRSKEFEAYLHETQERIRRVFALDKETHILFCQGGARTQFAMLPMNFLKHRAAYLNTGTWSDKAIVESERFGDTAVLASSKDDNFTWYPGTTQYELRGDEDYLHITSNNTVYGTQIHDWPDTGDVPVVVDMSSDIASRQLDFNSYDMIYAGAQKNIGPAGVTLVLMKDSFAQRAIQDDKMPLMFRYETYITKNSLYNTPPVFNIYVLGLVFEWIEENGGLAAIEANNEKKANLLYGLLDEYPEFFRGTVRADSRSLMNICLRLPTVELEKQLVADATEAGFVGVKGHSSVGGIRVSNYNAVPVDGVERFVEYMREYAKKHG